MDDERPIEVLFFWLDTSKKPIKSSILMDREEGTTAELLEKLSKIANVDVDKIYLAGVENNFIEDTYYIYTPFKDVRDVLNAYEIIGPSLPMIPEIKEKEGENMIEEQPEEDNSKKKKKKKKKPENDIVNLKVLHRKLQISKHFFITPYSTSLFTIPIIISFHSESTTFKQLYEIIYKQRRNCL